MNNKKSQTRILANPAQEAKVTFGTKNFEVDKNYAKKILSKNILLPALPWA